MDAPTKKNLKDAETVAQWLSSRKTDQQSTSSAAALRLIATLGAERASQLVMNNIRAINAGPAAKSAGPEFLTGAIQNPSEYQRLINDYSGHLDRLVKKSLIYDFVERLFRDQPQVFLFAAMTTSDIGYCNVTLGIPPIAGIDEEDTKRRRTALKKTRPGENDVEYKNEEVEEVIFGKPLKKITQSSSVGKEEIQYPLKPRPAFAVTSSVPVPEHTFEQQLQKHSSKREKFFGALKEAKKPTRKRQARPSPASSIEDDDDLIDEDEDDEIIEEEDGFDEPVVARKKAKIDTSFVMFDPADDENEYEDSFIVSDSYEE